MDEETLRQDAELLWADVLEAAGNESQELVPWLQRATPLSFDGSTMTLSTRQKWTERKLCGEYRKTIEDIMAEITLDHVSLAVLTGFEQQNTAAVQSSATENVSCETSVQPVSPAEQAGRDKFLGRAPIKSKIVNDQSRANVATVGETAGPLTQGNQEPEQKDVRSREDEDPKEDQKTDSGTDFTFDTYIIGESNLIAYNMAKSVAEQPDGSIFNPLFIWGPSGNGKTHLLCAIREYIQEHQPQTRVQYVASNTFVTQYVDDIRNKKLKGTDVLREYRDIDVLLVDDVQFFEDKQESVTAFFDIFNEIMMSGNKQIVLAADRAPDYLRLDARMKTRFNQGMVADIKAPTYEMKLSILKSFYDRCRRRNGMDGVTIDDIAFETMAKYCPNNPRNMLGLINNIMFRAEGDPTILTPEGIKTTIDTVFRSTTSITLQGIMRVVCSEMDVSIEQMCSDSRVKSVKEARQVVMWLASQLTDEPYSTIGAALNRDHSTVSHGIKKVNERRDQDRTYLHTLEDLKNKIVQ